MDNVNNNIPSKNIATIFLVSGELDKALPAFEIAAAMAAMGISVNMWFIFYGINSLKKPQNLVQRLKYFFKIMRNSPGRIPETDILPQRLIPFLNSPTCDSLPLSQLNITGIGRLLINFVMRQKNIPQLAQIVKETEALGVNFKICQPCIDILMLDIEEDLIVKAQASGVSSYIVDVMESHYNATF